MDDCIIEVVDTIISDEEIVENWDAKISRKIVNKLSVCDNEKVLEDMLRDYLWLLQHQTHKFKLKKLLKEKILKHVRVFHLCCVSISDQPAEMYGYWEKLENVLVILCNLELDVARHLRCDDIKEYRERIVKVTTQVIYTLSVFLLGDNTKIFHVLLKLKVRYDSRAWKDVMKVVYRHFLVSVPVDDKTEENFCRNYLLFQNYKKLLRKEHHEKMECFLFERFNMHPEILNKSRTLKKILLPSVNSVIDLVDMLTDSRRTAVDNYFKHIDRKNKDDDCIPFSINLESDSEDELHAISINKNKKKTTEISEIKIEDIIETIPIDDSGHVICVDDDSDVEEIELPTISRNPIKTTNSERTATFVSFLDSIVIPDEMSEDEPSTSTACDRIPSPNDESLSSSENTESPTSLPFLEFYLDNLKAKRQILDGNVSDMNSASSVTISEELSHLNLTNESAPLEEIPEATEVLPCTPMEDSSEKAPQEEDEENIDDMTSDPVSVDPKLVEATEELVEANEELVEPTEELVEAADKLELVTEKLVQLPTNTDEFHFISGIITPPISDRTNDDVSTDLSHANNGSKNVYVPNISMDDISFHQFESEMEMSLGNSAVNSPVANQECITTEGNMNEVSEEKTMNSDNSNSVESEESIDSAIKELNDSINFNHVYVGDSQTIMPVELRTDVNNEENASEVTLETEESQASTCITSTSADMVLEDFQLPIVQITETTLNNDATPSLLKSTSTDGVVNYELIIDGTLPEYETELDTSENHTPVDMIIEDCQLPVSEIREHTIHTHSIMPIIMNSSGILNYEPNIREDVGHFNEDDRRSSNNYDSLNQMVNAMESSSHSPYQNNCKVQASVNMGEIINGMNTKISAKLNGENINKVSKTKTSGMSYSPEKVIFTSSERVSAPLSVFSKFEQSQSELVETAFSGPIQPLYSYSAMDLDHSNSNDGLQSLTYIRTQPKITQVIPSTADSPVSPPYEQIHAQEYESHVMTVDYNNLNGNISTPLTHKPQTVEADTTQNKNAVTVPVSIISNRKRKLEHPRKIKVNFGPTEIRIIPRDDSSYVYNEFLHEATESMEEYNVTDDDAKLLSLKAKVGLRLESFTELEEKEQQLKIRCLLQPDRGKQNGNSCILKRVDYKKIGREVDPPVSSPKQSFGHSISNLINSPNVPTRMDPIPSGYIPPLNGYSSGFRYNYENMASNTLTDRNYPSDVRSKVVTKDTQASRNRTAPTRTRGRPKRILDPHYKYNRRGAT